MDGYYRSAFPDKEIFELFTLGCVERPDFREWGVELTDGTFKRWKRAASPAELKRLVAAGGVGKLNVGAVYDRAVDLRWRSTSALAPHPTKREFVIDIDLDDFEVAVAKDDLNACDRFWPLIAHGLYVTRVILERCFGVDPASTLAVYSGRRGGHLWVFDERMAALTDEQRRAVLCVLQPSGYRRESGAMSFYSILQQSAVKVCSDCSYSFFKATAAKSRRDGGLGLLDAAAAREAFLRRVDERPKAEMVTVVRSVGGLQCLEALEKFVLSKRGAQRATLHARLYDAVLTYVWPRLDANVSTHIAHTLKAPFSAHPSTRRVSMPVFGDLDAFDPASAPEATALTGKNAEFAASVRRLRAFVAHLRATPSPPPAPPVVFSLKTPRVPLAGPLTTDTDCIFWRLARAFTVVVTAGPTPTATLGVRTWPASTPVSIVVRAHAMPPIEQPRGDALDDILRVTKQAVLQPGVELVACTRVVLLKVPVADLATANARFERVRDHYGASCTLKHFSLSWQESSIRSALSSVVCSTIDCE